MSLLITPLWQNLNGDPRTGVSPPSLVMLSGRLTPQRHGEIRQIYMHFSMAKLTAVGDYFVFNRVLSDGTRVRIESMQGRDRVFVWASDAQSEDSWDKGWSFIPANDNSLGGFLRRPGATPDDLSAAAFIPLGNHGSPAGKKVHTFVDAKTGNRRLCTDREGGARMWRGGKNMPVLTYDDDVVWVDGVKSVLRPLAPQRHAIWGAAIAKRDGVKWLVFVVFGRLWAVRLSELKAQTNDCVDCGPITHGGDLEFSPDGMNAISLGNNSSYLGYDSTELKSIYRLKLAPGDGTVPFRPEVDEQRHDGFIRKRVINTFHFNQAKRNFVFHGWKDFRFYAQGTYYGVINYEIPASPVEIRIPRSDFLYDDGDGPEEIVFERKLRNGLWADNRGFITYTNRHGNSHRTVMWEVMPYEPLQSPSFGDFGSYCDARWGAVLDLSYDESISTQLNRHYGSLLNKRDYSSYLDFYEYLASRGNPLIMPGTKYWFGFRQVKVFPEDDQDNRVTPSFALAGYVLAAPVYTLNWTTDWVLESQVFLSGKAYIAAGYDAKGRERFLYMEGDDSQRLRYESSAKADDEPEVRLAWSFSGAMGYRLILDDEVIDSCTYAVADGVTLLEHELYGGTNYLIGPNSTIRAGQITVHDFDMALGHVLYRKSEEVFTFEDGQSENPKLALRLSYRDFLKTSKDKHQLGEERVFTSAQRGVDDYIVAWASNTITLFYETAPFSTRPNSIEINGVRIVPGGSVIGGGANPFPNDFASLVPQAQRNESGRLSGRVEERWKVSWLTKMMLYTPGDDNEICRITENVLLWDDGVSSGTPKVGRFTKPPQSHMVLRAYSDDCWLVCYQIEKHIQDINTDNTTARYFLKLAKDKPVKEFDAAAYFQYLGLSKKLLAPKFHIRKKT